MSDELWKAVSIAIKAHAGQVDKAGEPYILHVLRVAQGVPFGNARIVAMLHDVVEDGAVTFYDLTFDFEEEIVFAVDAISRRRGESYSDYIQRCGRNDLALQVKIADVRDNLDPARLNRLPRDVADGLRRRYEATLKVLEINAAEGQEQQPAQLRNWGVKITDEKGVTRWYTNERHTEQDAWALVRCYRKAHRYEPITFEAAKIQEGERY
jgi:guanosine-3',5'-bis(diphosphate) 3'-pyrophosphohydrolase